MKKKVIAVILSMLMVIASLTGCSSEKKDEKGGKESETITNSSDKKNETDSEEPVTITISNWPDKDNDPDRYATMAGIITKFNEKYPYITVVGDGYAYTSNTFTPRATAGNINTLTRVYFTETSKMSSAGYAKDITEVAKKYGYFDAMNKQFLDLMSVDGKLYGLPTSAYQMGLQINKALFKKAGLVNSDGSVKIPSTYEEMAEFAKIIKEKTGVPGYSIPTTGNCGGWNFMNIAWSHGVNFMKQDTNGKWVATFDSEEMRNALQYIKDLKWKYQVLPEDTIIDLPTNYEKLATAQAGMIFGAPPINDFTINYGMNKDDIVVAALPEGSAGRYAQIGGEYWMISSDATDAQVDACFKWLEYTGEISLTLDKERSDNLAATFQATLDAKGVVLPRTLFLWTNEDRVNSEIDLRAKYTNVAANDYQSYFDAKGVIARAEEPQCAQELYATIDSLIQEVISDKNADVAVLVSKSCADFQSNYLDQLE